MTVPTKDYGPFRTNQGQFRLSGLFFETAKDNDLVLYSLAEEDHELGFPSIYRLYLEEADPTEYNFATKYFYSYSHWKRITESEWFKPHIQKMREALRLKLSAQALVNIRAIANDRTHAGSMQANKLLLAQEYDKKIDAKVGRPSKKAIEQKAKEMVLDTEDTLEDAKRLGIVIQ